MKKSMLFIIVPFCSIFILVGGGIAIHSLIKIVEGVRAKDWPSTTGILDHFESKDTSDSESSSREIKVRYTYNVDGMRLEGNIIHPVYGESSFEEAHEGLEKVLSTARTVRVYYDPQNPKRSTLSAGFYSKSLALFFGGLLFLGAGVGFLGTFWFAIAGKMNVADGIRLMP